jgi:hypothetical protein
MTMRDADGFERERRISMTRDELLSLPVVVGLQTAGRAWGLSRSRVYDAHARGTLPFPVIEVSGRFKVTRAALLRSLDEAASATDAATAPDGGAHHDGTTLRAV